MSIDYSMYFTSPASEYVNDAPDQMSWRTPVLESKKVGLNTTTYQVGFF